MVFFCGMPSEAAGPVAEMVMPILICAIAVLAGSQAAARTVSAISRM